MKHTYLFQIIGLMTFLAFASCKKDTSDLPSGGTSLTIVDALVGSNNLVTNFDYNQQLSYYSIAAQISFGSAMEFSGYSGNVPLSLSQITDTSQTVYKQMVDIQKNTINSLFITGTVESPVSFLTVDHPPYHAASDSTVGVRFVNLSPGSSPVTVDIQGNTGLAVQSLAYKNVTDFKDYAATGKISSYVFEFRDASSAQLLTTYTLRGVNNGSNGNTSTNTVRWKNITIAIDGLPGSQHTFLIKNY